MDIRLLIFPALAVVFSVLSSCEGEQEQIPAYIRIDSVSLAASGLQGNAVHHISAVQVFTDGTLLGAFEIPATIPVLFSGKHKISLLAMTFINGSASQRAVYKPLLTADTTAELIPGKITYFNNAIFKFRNNTVFSWTEDFEDNNSSLISSHFSNGDTQQIQTVAFNLKNQFNGSTKALEIKMKGEDTAKYLDLISFNTFSGLPVTSTDIMLEFDLKSDLNVQIALDRINGSSHSYVPFLLCYPTEEWKRFYLNLVPEIAGQPSTNNYKIYFTVKKPASVKTDGYIYLDNIRFCYIP